MVPVQLLPLIIEYDYITDGMIMVPIYKYALQGILLFESVLIGILAIILYRRRSGVLRYPNDYASLAKFTSISSLQNSIYHVFEKLCIDDEIWDDELERKLGKLQFELQAQNLVGGGPQFNIIQVNEKDLDPQSNIVLNAEDSPLLQKDSIKPAPPHNASKDYKRFTPDTPTVVEHFQP